MTEKTDSMKTAAPAPKAEVKAPVAKKAAAKKVTPIKSVYEQFENSVFAVPVKLANKTFMASLGVFSYVQQEFDKQYKAFDRQFTKYAKDGEKVFDRWEDRVEDFRKDVEKKVDGAYDRVRDTFNKAA